MRSLAAALVVCLSLSSSPPVLATGEDAKSASAAANRLAWWQDARFGMFIHFGVYATLGRGEWVRSVERISVESYQPFVDGFDPKEYDARGMARLAKAAGMRYAVLTAKHHDGFCLWDSKLTDYKSTRTPIKRDLVREFLDAFRAEGLKVGLYYSLLDWHHPDYPHFGDNHHPARDDAAWRDKKHDFSRYLSYLHGQVKELMTGYGRIDVLWLDFSYGEMVGEAWRARALVDMVRKAQPHIIINNRLGGDGMSGATGLGDFVTPEQEIPDATPTDAAGRALPWETCLTLNNSWGYSRNDQAWKSSRQIIGALVNVVSKGGNLLLNIGPDGRGRVPEESVRILSEVGRWMKDNGGSIHGAGPAALARPEWGRYTQKGNTLFAHVIEPPIGQIKLAGLKDRVRTLRVLADGSAVFTATEKWGHTSGDALYVNLAKPVHNTYPMPDPFDTVLAIELR